MAFKIPPGEAARRGSYVYILLLTAKGNQEDVISGLEAGADDYLTKPFHALELKARLRSGRRILELQEQLISAREALRVRATHDPLTGLWNAGRSSRFWGGTRTRGRERTPLASSWLTSTTSSGSMTPMGTRRRCGSARSRQAAVGLRASLRFGGPLWRRGVLDCRANCDMDSGLNLAQRLRLSLDQNPVETPEGAISITLSLACCRGMSSGKDIDALVRAADAALYRAKANGRNRIELAGSEIVPGEVAPAPSEADPPTADTP